MSKQRKRAKVLKWILLAAVIVLILELILLVLFERKRKDILSSSDNETEAAIIQEEQEEEEEIPETSEVEVDIPESVATDPIQETTPEASMEIVECVNDQIQTPYFPLYYPEAMADLLVVVKTADEPFSLEFYAMLEDKPEQRLFDIQLSPKVQGNLGIVKTETADIYVGTTFYQFNPDDSWTEDEINTVWAMQEAANELISRLDLEEDSSEQVNQPTVEEVTPESSVVNVLNVKTPYCTLNYPVRWKDYLVVEQSENEETGVYSVQFYGKVADKRECLMFTILFGGDEGDQLGAFLNDQGEYVVVSLMLEELKTDGWNEEETQIVCAMQEAVNVLIAQLPLE